MKMYNESKDIPLKEKMEDKIPNIEPEIPKFIRGPTDYKIGQFRNIREGPKDTVEILGKIQMREEAGERTPVEYERTLESANAKLFIGKVSEHQKVILATQKNDNHSLNNTYKNPNINMQRSSELYKRRYSTFTENMDQAFCHFISKTDPTGNFIEYLERASEAAQTREIKAIFPFLGHSEAMKELNKLYFEKDQLESHLENTSPEQVREATAQINNQIDRLRQSIYDNRFKKAQFIKRLDHLFESNSNQTDLTDEEKSDYWLWVWLKKLLNYLEEEDIIDVS